MKLLISLNSNAAPTTLQEGVRQGKEALSDYLADMKTVGSVRTKYAPLVKELKQTLARYGKLVESSPSPVSKGVQAKLDAYAEKINKLRADIQKIRSALMPLNSI